MTFLGVPAWPKVMKSALPKQYADLWIGLLTQSLPGALGKAPWRCVASTLRFSRRRTSLLQPRSLLSSLRVLRCVVASCSHRLRALLANSGPCMTRIRASAGLSWVRESSWKKNHSQRQWRHRSRQDPQQLQWQERGSATKAKQTFQCCKALHFLGQCQVRARWLQHQCRMCQAIQQDRA